MNGCSTGNKPCLKVSVHVTWLFFPKMVPVTLGNSYHIDVYSSVRFFGLVWFQVVIWCYTKRVCRYDWQLCVPINVLTINGGACDWSDQNCKPHRLLLQWVWLQTTSPTQDGSNHIRIHFYTVGGSVDMLSIFKYSLRPESIRSNNKNGKHYIQDVLPCPLNIPRHCSLTEFSPLYSYNPSKTGMLAWLHITADLCEWH